MTDISFADIAIVSCGTLSLELNHLRAEGFLDTEHLFFTTPGLHEDIHELECQLLDRITKAREKADKILVVYGGKFCYVNADEPTRTMQQIIAEQGAGVARIQATHCMNMLASEVERERIAAEVAGGTHDAVKRRRDGAGLAAREQGRKGEKAGEDEGLAHGWIR